MEKIQMPPFMQRIQTRILMLITLTVIATGAVAMVLVQGYIAGQTRKELHIEAETISRLIINSTLTDIDERGHNSEISESLGHITWNGEARKVDIIDMNGVVKYSAFNEDTGNKVSVCGSCHITPGARPTMKRLDRLYGGIMDPAMDSLAIIPMNKTCARCHKTAGAHLGVIRMDISIKVHNEFMRRMMRWGIVSSALAVVLITMIVSFGLGRAVTKPITEMISELARIGEGDFTRPLGVRGEGEIAMLSAAIEKMRDGLARREDELRQRDTHIVELDGLRSNLEKANASLRHIVSELSLLNNIGATASATLDMDELFEKLDGVIRETLDLENISLFLFNEKKQTLELRAATGLPPESTARSSVKPGEGLAGKVFQSSDPLVIHDASSDANFDPHAGIHPDTRSLVCIPLSVRLNNIGVLCISSRKPGLFTNEELPFFGAVANHLAIALDNARMYEIQKELATTDSLTGLLNHGALQTRLNEEVSRVLRYPRPLSIIMLDLDRFKLVNDTFGHQTGDKVLVEVARIIREQTREVDVCARYGGEEFAVMLPETDLDGARAVAERIRVAAESGDYCLGVCIEKVSATISAGVTEFRGAGDTASCLIERADKALYRAKESGRNRVEMSSLNDGADQECDGL